MCLLLNCISSLVKSLFTSFAHFLNWIACFLFVEFLAFSVYSGYKSISTFFAHIFSQSVTCFSIFLMVSFEVFNVNEVHSISCFFFLS